MPGQFEQPMLEQLAAAGGAAALDEATGAALACIAYRDLWNRIPAGWEELARANDQASGYDGIAFHHPASRSLVVASRGVEGASSVKDWLVSAAMALTRHRGQIPLAVDLLRRAWAAAPKERIDRLYLVGHSLGGAMSDALAAVGRSALPDFGQRPIGGLGIASAGFADAVRSFAAASGLAINTDDGARVRHFVRKRDAVPNHFRRKVFGQDEWIASVFHGRFGQRRHKSQVPVYSWGFDYLDNHQQLLHWRFLAEPRARHVWRNAAGEYAVQDGAQPAWRPQRRRPDGF